MTEIPEHLLRRSRERRAALGLGSGDEEGGAGPAGVEPATPARSAAPAAPPGGIEPAAGAAPAVIEVEPVVIPTYIAPTGPHKTKVPIWVLPVLVALPLWAALYPGAFGNHTKTAVSDPLVIGAQVYRSAGCSGCHGANGEGGVGPALHGGQSKLTFPNVADHVNWVKTGSQSLSQGTKYGDPNREGGQREVKETSGDMPAFSGSLSQAQIDDVVQYEREKL